MQRRRGRQRRRLGAFALDLDLRGLHRAVHRERTRARRRKRLARAGGQWPVRAAVVRPRPAAAPVEGRVVPREVGDARRDGGGAAAGHAADGAGVADVRERIRVHAVHAHGHRGRPGGLVRGVVVLGGEGGERVLGWDAEGEAAGGDWRRLEEGGAARRCADVGGGPVVIIFRIRCALADEEFRLGWGELLVLSSCWRHYCRIRTDNRRIR